MADLNKLKRILSLILQLALLVIAAFCFFYAANNFAVRCIGILAIFTSLAIARRSRMVPAAPEVQAMQGAWALKPWHWLVGLALVIGVAAALAWLYWASATGYKGVAPVYAFAAAAVVCGGWWAGLVARWLNH